jgi:hypothetical protein
MKWIRGIAAFAAAGALAFGAMRLAEQPVAVASVREPLVAADAIDSEKVAEVVLERDGVRHRFERRAGAWQQTEPVVAAVDGWSMRQLVSRVLKTESVRRVALDTRDAAARDAALAEAGLKPAAARIELREEASAAGGAAPRSVVIELGRRSLAGRAVARVGGDGAGTGEGDGRGAAGAAGGTRAAASGSYHVVDAALHEFALGRDPKEFRRREVFADLGEVERIVFKTPQGELTLARDGRSYRLEAPVRTRADRVQVEELVDALRRAKSSGFVSDRPAELSAYGLAPAMATLEVDSGGTRRALLIGDAVSIGAQDRFGMLDGTTTVVRLPAAVLAPMLPRVERLIDATASGVRARDVAGIELTLGSNRLSLRRETDGWSASASAQGADPSASLAGSVERDAVERLLKALIETRASSVELAAFPSDEAVATVTFLGFAGEPLDTVRIARRAADSKMLLENGDGVLRAHGSIDLPLTAEELGFRAKSR